MLMSLCCSSTKAQVGHSVVTERAFGGTQLFNDSSGTVFLSRRREIRVPERCYCGLFERALGVLSMVIGRGLCELIGTRCV